MKRARLISLLFVCTVAASVSGCFKPPRNMPNESSIGFDGHSALPPDCTTLARPSILTDAGWRRPSMEWGCATYTNLAVQLARPEDAAKPQTLGPADAAVAASAVRRYQSGRVLQLDTTSSREAK